MLEPSARLRLFGFGTQADAERPRRDLVVVGAEVLLGLHVALHLVLHARLGVIGAALWYIGPSLLGGLAGLLLLFTLVRAIRRRQTWTEGGWIRFALLLAVATAPVLFRTYPGSHDGAPSSVRFELPLRGQVTVAWGGGPRDVNFHVIAPDQRWGYDLLVTANRRSFRGTGQALTDYYVYGQQVFSPVAGTVHSIHDGEPEVAIGGQARGDDLGNHVAIEVAPGEYLFLAHLQPGSITVAAGDRVAPGQPLGLVGNSGRTAEPHLHVHLQDSSRRHLAEGVPFYFSNYCQGDALLATGMPLGGRDGRLWTGAIVSRAGIAGCAS